jgi:hypothetical protein
MGSARQQPSLHPTMRLPHDSQMTEAANLPRGDRADGVNSYIGAPRPHRNQEDCRRVPTAPFATGIHAVFHSVQA